nr:hypothetical protein [Dissulfuribacter thermophilus]
MRNPIRVYLVSGNDSTKMGKRNLVLHGTGHRACLATYAFSQVYNHAPTWAM